ncbi:MAG: M48 family metallopeptidase [Deltaproteobacteria bacterium]|nr:M48 family metallopeptidase [Deltaproteobacteria bacterium]
MAKKKTPPTPERVRFPGLSPRAYEHPSDRAALVALRKVPGFDFAVRKLFGFIGDRSLRLATLASAVRVSPTQFPKVHTKYLEACAILDIVDPPELFIAQTPIVNAGAVGIDEPFIVINSGTVMLMDEDELQFILAHELGHVLSEHVLYKTMIRLMLRMTIIAMAVPLGGAALFAILAALLEWDRKSELSADRAGLLVVQDPAVAYRAHMKLAGGGQMPEMSVDEFLAQAEEYREGGTVADGVVKLLNLIGRTHPFPVLRLHELKAWAEGDAYQELMKGEYPRRHEDPETSLYSEIMRGGAQYKDDFEKSPDPLFGFVKDLRREVVGGAQSVASFIRNKRGGGDADAANEPAPDA